jgi:hypothetical protein
MSTPKKIRATYEMTFRKLISTSPASKKFRQFLSSVRTPAVSFNLPITLADVKAKLLSPLTAVKKPRKRKPAKATVKKTTTRRRKSSNK